MPDDPHDRNALVEEIKTAEFVVPIRRELEDELEAATVIAPLEEGSNRVRRLVAAALKELEASTGDSGRRARIHLSLGLIIERRLGDVRRAIQHYLEAHRLAPSNLAAIRSARRVFWTRQNWTMVLALLDEELALTSHPGQAARLLYEKARICEEWLANTDGAIAALTDALKQEPGNRRVLLRLRRIFWRRRDFEGLLEVCRRATASTKDRRHRGLLFAEIARIHEEVGDESAAMESYAVAFAEDPANVSVSDALKRMFRRHGRWGDLVDLLLTEADLAVGDQDRALAYRTAAQLCRERLGQQDRALELLSRASDLVPADSQVLEEAADLLHEAGRFRELAEVQRRRLDTLVDEWERVTAHYRLGQVLEDRLGDEEEALFHYRRAVAIDPSYVPALQALGKLCQRRGEWAELVAIGAAEAESIQDAALRASRFSSLADLCETRLGDMQQAIEYHHRALASLPQYEPSEHALERLFLEEEDWEALADLWESQLEREQPEERGRILERLGELCEGRIGDLERAVSYYRRALEVRQDGDRRLFRALERLLSRLKRWEEVVQVLDLEIAATSDEPLAVALAHRAADLCEHKLADVDQAILRYRRVLERAPDYAPNLQSLGRVCFRQGKWEEVLALYQTEVNQEGVHPGRRSSLLYKMGELYQEHLGDEEQAVRAYVQALEATPRFLPALQALAGLYRKQGDWERLVEVLERQAEVLSDPERKASTLYAIGELYECQLGQKEQAIRCHRTALEQFPCAEPTQTALLRLLADAERWGEVAEVYDRAITGTADGGAKVALLKSLGLVWSDRLLDPQQAVKCYEQVLALAEDDLETLEALSKLYRRTGNHEKLVDVHERLAICATDPAQAVAYLHEAASLTELHVPEADPSPLYERIVHIREGELSAFEALCRHYTDRADLGNLLRIYDSLKDLFDDKDSKVAMLIQLAGFREAAGDLAGAAWALGEAVALTEDWVVVRELRRLREQLGQWEGVAASLERESDLGRDVQLAVECLMAAADVYTERFQDQDRAATILARVLERDPFHEEAATRLEQLLVQREDWNGLVSVLRRRLDAIDAGARPQSGNVTQAQIELLARMAWIQREHLRQPLEAVATLNRSLQLDPNHLPTLLTLAELHVGLEQWKEAVDAYSRIVAVSSDTDVLRSAHFRLGDIWSERLGDHRRAISSYQNVLALAATDTTALKKLFDLFVRGRDWENAADTVARLAEVDTAPVQLVQHYAALAEIQEKGFGDPHMAATQLQQALAIDPTNEAILGRLTQLLAHLGDWEALAGGMRSFLVALPSDQESRGVTHRLQLAGILRQRLVRNMEALEQYQAVVEIDPTNIDARLATASILVEEGRLDEAITQHREIQALDTLNVNSLRQMRAVWSRMGNSDMAYTVAAALVCLGGGNEADESLYRERRAKGVRHPTVTLEPVVFETEVVHPDEHPVGRRLLAVLGEIAHRIRPPRLADWRVGKADRLPIRSDDPLRVMAREVATALGLDRELEIYISPIRSRELELLLTDSPAVVVGGGVMGTFSSMEVRFWLGLLLSYLRNRTYVAYGLGGMELGLLVRAACRVVDPNLAIGQDDAEVAETARLIQRSVSRRTRRMLEEVCLEFVAGPEPPYGEWARAMQRTALHTGLWVVNDLETALAYLRRTDPELGRASESDKLVARVRRHPLAADLVEYWLSEEFDSLRRASV